MDDAAAIKRFMERHFRHFNARTMVAAAQGWADALGKGERMFLSLAGAMSTAELGRSLAQLIRAGKVHAISCTGANLEEDVFNLVAHEEYEIVGDWRALSASDEQALLARRMNRITDTCIPEDAAMQRVEDVLLPRWQRAEREGRPQLPHRFLYDALLAGELAPHYQIDPADSWLLAAAQRDLPLFVPGWEDSTLGNVFAGLALKGGLEGVGAIRGGLDYMLELVAWYRQLSASGGRTGFFQIGGGIAGDFAICVVPLIEQDLYEAVPLWSYFCQIGDSTTSYGSYSGAPPNEKITWGKLGPDTPRFMIESDATIVAPLIFAYVMAATE